MPEHVIAQHDCVLPGCGLRVRLHYPAKHSDGARRARWMPQSAVRIPNENVRALAHYLGFPWPALIGTVASFLLNATLPWYADAPPDRDGGAYPLVLFSHGLGSSLAGYVSVCSALAQAGYVVAAVEHAEGSAHCAYVGPERRPVPYVHPPQERQAHDQLAASQNVHRVKELSDVLFDLRAMNAGEGEAVPLTPCTTKVDFTGMMETSKVLVAGHSFGAGTALAFGLASFQRKVAVRVEKVVCLDAWLTPIGRDVLALGDFGNLDILCVDQELTGTTESALLLRRRPAPRDGGALRRVVVIGGVHNNATDFAVRIPRLIAVGGGLAAPRLDPEDAMRAQNTAVVHFVNGDWDQFEALVKFNQVDGLRMP